MDETGAQYRPGPVILFGSGEAAPGSRRVYDALFARAQAPVRAAILEKDNAVEAFRNLIGATNPANAEPHTIRAKYATSIGENAVHGSDSDENAAIEGAFHFGGVEMF